MPAQGPVRSRRHDQGGRHAAGASGPDDVLVIGGGIAGLTVAWKLRDRKVRLLEAASEVGGVSKTETGAVLGGSRLRTEVMLAPDHANASYRPHSSPSGATRTLLRWLHRGGFAVAIFAVALQMGGVNGGFLTNYLADLAGPIWFYGALRERATLLRYVYPPIPSPALTAVFVFLVGTGWEVCQALDLGGVINHLTRGRYDPFDILAYATSLSMCYAADMFVQRRASKPSTMTEQVQRARERQ
jgi:hypothetical protein